MVSHIFFIVFSKFYNLLWREFHFSFWTFWFEQLRTCLVHVFVFYFGFVTFYFIEIGTLILIWIQDCKKNSVWYIILVLQLKS